MKRTKDSIRPIRTGNDPLVTSKFKPEYVKQAENICTKHNYTNEELAEHFDVSMSTITSWGVRYPEFREACWRGRDEHTVTKVEPALCKRAMGFESVERKVETFPNGEEKVTVTTKQIPPDTQAMMFFLLNRTPDRWKHVRRIEQRVTHDNKGVELDLSRLPAKELANLRKLMEGSKGDMVDVTPSNPQD